MSKGKKRVATVPAHLTVLPVHVRHQDGAREHGVVEHEAPGVKILGVHLLLHQHAHERRQDVIGQHVHHADEVKREVKRSCNDRTQDHQKDGVLC